MPDPPAIPSPTDPKGAADLARYLQSVFAPAQTGASGLLAQIAAPGGIYDPTADLALAAQKSQLAQNLPTQADIDAQQAGLQARGADYLYNQLSGVPIPQEAPLEQPNLPQLQLPGLPQAARPQVSPLASLLAIGAGFAAPKAAGQFNAVALEGAIRGAGDENQRRQQSYREDVTRRAMLYDAAMSAAKERERITESNRDTAFKNAVTTTDRQMMLAKARTEQFTAHGAADSLKAFADKYDPALKARDEVKSLLDQIDARGKASSDRVKSVSELLTAVHKEDTGGVGMAKEVFGQIMKGQQEAAVQRHQDERQIRHDQQVANAAAARESARLRVEAQMNADRIAGENRRNAATLANSMAETILREKHADARLMKQINSKPTESLEQSQDNQKRLQTRLGAVEDALTTAQAALSALLAGGTVGGASGPEAIKAYRAQVDSLLKRGKDISDAIRKEQTRASRLDPRARGGVDQIFDPSLGEGILP